MSEIWAPIISGLTTIIVTVITQLFLYWIETYKIDAGKRKKGGRPKRENSSGNTAPKRTKFTNKWPISVLFGLIVGVLSFPIAGPFIENISGPIIETATPTISLLDTKVEFGITINDNQIAVPAGGTLVSLHAGDNITIETKVTDANGNPYPHELAFLYFFTANGNFSGKVAPYFVRQSDTITVQIEDHVTGEVITRIMLIEVN